MTLNPPNFVRRLVASLPISVALLAGDLSWSAPLIHYIVSDYDTAAVAAGTIPNPGTLADGTTGAYSQPVVTLSTDIPTMGVPYGLGNRSMNCAGTSGVIAPGTKQLSRAAIAANGGFTYETWFRWNGVSGQFSVIDYAGTEQILLNGGNVFMGTNNTSYPFIGTVSPNQWHYLAVVFKATSGVLPDGSVSGAHTFYLNGLKITGTASGVNITTFGDDLNRTIGVAMHPSAGFNGNYFQGLIYSPRVTLGALTVDKLLWKQGPELKSVFIDGTGTAARLKADFQSPNARPMFHRVSRDLKTWHVPGRAGMPAVSQTVTAQPGVLRATLEAPLSANGRIFLRASDGLNRKGFCDFDGDGVTDWTIARPVSNIIEWHPTYRNGVKDAVVSLGNSATDYVVPADYDGDGITDFAVWSNKASGEFRYRRSSDGQVVTIPFGTTDDNISIAGDYDGDGTDDPALFRTPGSGAPAGQCRFLYVRSSSYPAVVITEIPWGFGANGDLYPYPGDFDGDGKNDFCYQKPAATGSGGEFHLLLSSNGSQEIILFGNASDFLVPGDYDGDGRTDFCVRRTVGAVREHRILERDGGGTGATPIVFGAPGDQSLGGDYDGDGISDLGVWRSSLTAGESKFIVKLSTTGVTVEFKSGARDDFAVAGWQVN